MVNAKKKTCPLTNSLAAETTETNRIDTNNRPEYAAPNK